MPVYVICVGTTCRDPANQSEDEREEGWVELTDFPLDRLPHTYEICGYVDREELAVDVCRQYNQEVIERGSDSRCCVRHAAYVKVETLNSTFLVNPYASSWLRG